MNMNINIRLEPEKVQNEFWFSNEPPHICYFKMWHLEDNGDWYECTIYTSLQSSSEPDSDVWSCDLLRPYHEACDCSGVTTRVVVKGNVWLQGAPLNFWRVDSAHRPQCKQLKSAYCTWWASCQLVKNWEAWVTMGGCKDTHKSYLPKKPWCWNFSNYILKTVGRF